MQKKALIIVSLLFICLPILTYAQDCGDGKCDAADGETTLTCRIDCAPSQNPATTAQADEQTKIPWAIIGISAGALVIIAVVVLYILKKKKQEPQAPQILQEQPANEQPQSPVQQ